MSRFCSSAIGITEQRRQKCPDGLTGPFLGATTPPHHVATTVNQVRCGQAAEFIARTDGTIAVQQRRELEMVFVHERSDLVPVFLHGHGPHHKRSLLQRLVELVHQWHFLQTGMTPGGPEIEQHHLATLVLQA